MMVGLYSGVSPCVGYSSVDVETGVAASVMVSLSSGVSLCEGCSSIDGETGSAASVMMGLSSGVSSVIGVRIRSVSGVSSGISMVSRDVPSAYLVSLLYEGLCTVTDLSGTNSGSGIYRCALSSGTVISELSALSSGWT